VGVGVRQVGVERGAVVHLCGVCRCGVLRGTEEFLMN